MTQATVATKGQVTIPIEIREHLSLSQGDKLKFLIEEDGKVSIFAKKLSFDDVVGMFDKRGHSGSTRNFDDAIKSKVIKRTLNKK